MGDIEYTSHPEVRKSERDYIYFISLFNLLTVLSVTTNWCDTKPWFEIWCTNFNLPATSHSYSNMIQKTTQGSVLQGLQLVFFISHASPKYFNPFFSVYCKLTWIIWICSVKLLIDTWLYKNRSNSAKKSTGTANLNATWNQVIAQFSALFNHKLLDQIWASGRRLTLPMKGKYYRTLNTVWCEVPTSLCQTSYDINPATEV